jgi:ribosomal protein L37AE/L43A
MNASAALLAHIPIPPKLLVSLIVLALALIIWAIVAAVNRGSKGPQVPQGAPACPACHSPARWAYTHWVCDRCQRALPPPGQHPGQPMMHGQMPPQMQQMPPQQMPNMAPPNMPPQMHGQPQMPNMAPPQQQQMAGPTCATCRGPGRWIPESNGWGCDRCRQMIQPIPAAPN